jgi:hypothetical protein
MQAGTGRRDSVRVLELLRMVFGEQYNSGPAAAECIRELRAECYQQTRLMEAGYNTVGWEEQQTV